MSDHRATRPEASSRRNTSAGAVDRIILFGGRDVSGVQAGTFKWNGSAWADVSITGTSPCPRISARMAYDPASGDLIMFGGQAGSGCSVTQGNFMDETWKYDGEAGTWTQVCTAGGCSRPDPRISQGMATDEVNGDIVLYGENVDPGATSMVGESNEPDVAADDTWVYDSSNVGHEWELQDPANVRAHSWRPQWTGTEPTAW